MSTTNKKAALNKIVAAVAKDQEQPISSGMNHLAIETIQSADQINTIVTENCDSSISDASEDANAEMSWLAKAFDPTVPKVEDWEEDWDSDSESE